MVRLPARLVVVIALATAACSALFSFEPPRDDAGDGDAGPPCSDGYVEASAGDLVYLRVLSCSEDDADYVLFID